MAEVTGNFYIFNITMISGSCKNFHKQQVQQIEQDNDILLPFMTYFQPHKFNKKIFIHWSLSSFFFLSFDISLWDLGMDQQGLVLFPLPRPRPLLAKGLKSWLKQQFFPHLQQPQFLKFLHSSFSCKYDFYQILSVQSVGPQSL